MDDGKNNENKSPAELLGKMQGTLSRAQTTQSGLNDYLLGAVARLNQMLPPTKAVDKTPNSQTLRPKEPRG